MGEIKKYIFSHFLYHQDSEKYYLYYISTTVKELLRVNVTIYPAGIDIGTIYPSSFISWGSHCSLMIEGWAYDLHTNKVINKPF